MKTATVSPGYAENRADHLTRLRRIEGQVRGLQRLIEEDTYCIDVLTQVASVTRALHAVALNLLDEHLHHCVAEGHSEISEATKAVERLLRS